MEDLLVMGKKNSEGKTEVTLNREAFRKDTAFSWVYSNVKEDDFNEIYKRLYTIYEHNSSLITTEPPPTRPEEFKRVINDDDVLDLESCVGMMFTMGINFLASELDQLAGRPFIPRDPTTDGSYETAKRNSRKFTDRKGLG